MDEHSWEYCELWTDKSDLREDMYDLVVRYYGAGSSIFYRIAESRGKNATAFTFNPYSKAYAILAGAGWELVSQQLANVHFDNGWGLDFHQRITTFKRPMVAGRAIDEPKLIELIKP